MRRLYSGGNCQKAAGNTFQLPQTRKGIKQKATPSGGFFYSPIRFPVDNASGICYTNTIEKWIFCKTDDTEGITMTEKLKNLLHAKQWSGYRLALVLLTVYLLSSVCVLYISWINALFAPLLLMQRKFILHPRQRPGDTIKACEILSDIRGSHRGQDREQDWTHHRF